MRNPTYEQVAFADAVAKGVTCRSCEHWRRDDLLRNTRDEYCYLNKQSFPDICRWYEYMPGTDQDLHPEE